MTKKVYRKPELKTRKIELGVFGDYSNTIDGHHRKVTPIPVEVIRDLHLHMD